MTSNNTISKSNPTPAPSPFGVELFRHIKTSLIATIVLALIVSNMYPVLVWGLSQAIFKHKADGSLIGKDGRPVSKDADAAGSSLIGQNFSAAQYFHPRPSAAGGGYDPTASGGSNLGPTSAKLMFGTTKFIATTVFAADKSHPAVVPVSGRVLATVAAVSKTTITVSATADVSAMVKTTTYALDPSVADPNAIANFHGRTVHATTITAGAIVELKLNDGKPPMVTAINVIDQELDGAASAIDIDGNKITLPGDSPTVINIDPKNTMIVVNGRADAKLSDIAAGMTIHAEVASVMDYDGVADRVVHYCQDNKIGFTSSIPDSAFMDADGLDDVKLISAFGGSSAPPTIEPKTPVPADAVTASASGLDPHISPANAALQTQRVADARGVAVEKVKALITANTDTPSLGILGDPGVNVLRLNLALDQLWPSRR